MARQMSMKNQRKLLMMILEQFSDNTYTKSTSHSDQPDTKNSNSLVLRAQQHLKEEG